MGSFKALVRRSPFFPAAREIYGCLWGLGHRLGFGEVPAPHAYKQRVVKSFGRRFELTTLVETGTYMGHMLDAVRGRFDRVYSIELDDALFDAAQRRFRMDRHVHILQGDSGELLPRVLAELDAPALFWLDAHYSGPGTGGEDANPVEREVLMVLRDGVRNHVLLIDDAREFTGSDGYPTLDRLRGLVEENRPDMSMSVDADIIRIIPR